jgi:UDP-glucose 4-epimerase
VRKGDEAQAAKREASALLGDQNQLPTELVRRYSGRKVIVTGGLGFIGSNVALALDRLGAEVLVIDAFFPTHGGNRQNLVGASPRLAVSEFDLRDRAKLEAAVPGVDTIFNLAGQVSHIDSMNDPRTDLELNTMSQVELLEACRMLNPAARILYASTRQIYGRPDYVPVDEDHPLRPIDPNGVSKMAGEAYHTLFHQRYGLRTTSLRLTNTYGPRLRIKDARQTFVGLWFRRVLEDTALEVWGGDQIRDLTYVDDVVTAFLLAGATDATNGGVFNIGGSEAITLIKLAELLVSLAGRGRIDVRPYPEERRGIEIGDYYAEDGRFRALTGWQPTVTLRDGLEQSLDYFAPRLALYV